MKQNLRWTDERAQLCKCLGRWKLISLLLAVFAACATVQALRHPAPAERLVKVQARLLELAREIRP